MTMKAHISHRALLPKLNICLVICCCFALLSSRACNARPDINSDAAVKKVPEDVIKSSIVGASQVNEGLKSADEVDNVSDKRHRRVTEDISKLYKDVDVSKEKTVTRNVDKKMDEIVERRFKESQEKKEEQKTFKRLIKRPIRRLKRNDQDANQKKDEIVETLGKSINDKQSKVSNNEAQNKKIDVEGIRILSINVEEEEKKKLQNVLKESTDNSKSNIVPIVEIKSNINDEMKDEIVKNIEYNREQENESKSKKVESHDAILKESFIAEKSAVGIREKMENELKQELNGEDEKKVASNRAEAFPKLEILRNQALEFQAKIRNSTFLQSIKDTMTDILPDIPNFTENQFLEILKNITSKKYSQEETDLNVNSFEDSGLTDKQIEILKCAQQLVVQKERQSFVENITECIRGLNVINCMRVFIYPIIAENMPGVLTQAFSNFPIEINILDLFQGNRDKPKTGRQVPIYNYYMKQIDPDAIIFDLLTDGLKKFSVYENLPSFITAKNESFSKLLSCNRLQLLRMTEKFLPLDERQHYSDEMLSCVQRFEYFSCFKYFSWPAIRKYSTLPQFPLSDAFLTSLIYPNYPLITYPGYESGFNHLPEIIDSGPARMKLETVILHIFRKALNDYIRIPTQPTPIQSDLFYKNQIINAEQLATVHLAEQLLPIPLRIEYVTKMSQCIRRFDYYNCMRYVTWPAIRQSNPSVPSFQDIINNFQFPDISQIPGISNFFDFFSQFQLPQFPQFQLPEISNFSFPDFSSFIPNFGQQSSTTAKPPIESPPADSVAGDKKSNDAIESKIYKILKNVRDSMGATPLSPSTYTNRKIFLFPLMTEEQSKIFALAESIIPPIDREPLITSMYFCLNDKNSFSTCTRTTIWPSLRNYIKGLPEFPTEDYYTIIQQKIKLNIPDEAYAMPIGSSDNFFIMREIEKIFTEGREDAMKYILRSIQTSFPSTPSMQQLLELLRSIQLKTSDFLNVQMIRYSRIPELASIATENQENIIHAVESIILQETRQKFQSDVIDCLQKNKFPICSRNIIFPSIYRYFQNALSIPYNIMQENKFKQQEKSLNLLYSNPEAIILSMLRKVQITSASSPNLPKESIANTAEFRKAFNIRQAHILITTEAILPEEYRKRFLDEMFKCNQKNTFLNCSKDILFPLIKKAYSDFPDFPNIENDLNRSRMLQIIDSFKDASSSTRPYHSSKGIFLPWEILYKSAPDDRTDKLKVLIDKLPDSLYYTLYLRMTQCEQYSDDISCSHDIIYPILKQYYDAPNFNLDDYYAIKAHVSQYPTMANVRSPYNYEILCENMGLTCTLIPFGARFAEGLLNLNISPSSSEISYMPFGKLFDGSRIFKRSQDVWNLYFTPSVGADKTFRDSTSRSPDRFLKLDNKSIFFSLKRNKRNVDDLLNSYPDVVSVNKKNSVPRRIPPKSSFPNITETELLQILIYIAKFKNEPAIGNEDVISNDYFVDSLNETDRALLTADQYEILKLVQELNAETAKAGFMRKMFQCIRSLSFLRCVGIFIWPMIASNLPSLPFSFATTRESRAIEEMQIKQMFGVSSSEFETELISRKEQIEFNFVHWYKELTENKFEKYIGPLKVIGYGNGELAIKFVGQREGRLFKNKDKKNLPSILTIISDVIEEVFEAKSNKTKHKKDNLSNDKSSRSLSGIEESYDLNESKKRSVKDDQVVNMLLERSRPSVGDVEDEDMKHYFSVEDAYRAFQVLFSPKVSSKIANQLKSFNAEHYKHFEKNIDDLKSVDDLDVVPLNIHEKLSNEKFKIFSFRNGRSMSESSHGTNKPNILKENLSSEKLIKFKSYVAEYLKKFLNLNKKNVQTGLTLRLPRLNDNIEGKKITNSIVSFGRDMKKKMASMMPAAGIAATLVLHLTLAHLKAAANVSNLLSNMALGSAMLGIARDMILGTNQHPKVKYVYADSDKYDSSFSWSSSSSNPITRY